MTAATVSKKQIPQKVGKTEKITKTFNIKQLNSATPDKKNSKKEIPSAVIKMKNLTPLKEEAASETGVAKVNLSMEEIISK